MSSTVDSTILTVTNYHYYVARINGSAVNRCIILQLLSTMRDYECTHILVGHHCHGLLDSRPYQGHLELLSCQLLLLHLELPVRKHKLCDHI